jgi:hypothetical protein
MSKNTIFVLMYHRHKFLDLIDRRIILKWILEKYEMVLWTASIWFGIRIIGGLM